MSENTNVLHNSSDNSETVVNETTRYDGETSPNVVDYYKVSESTLTVDENGNKYLRVYIKTEYSKAKITLNGKIYTGITDDDTVISGSNVVNGGDIHGILIPVKDGESVKVIPYVVTSEDGRHTSNNALNVTIQSINTNADYVTVNGVEAYGPFTEDDSDLPYYNSYIPYSVYEKAVNNAEKTSVVVQAAVQSKDTTAELLWEDGDFDYHGNDAKYNIPFRVSHSYLFDDADPDIPHVVKFRIISEAGTMQEYELRVYLADNTNRDVEYDAESDNYSVWVGPAGTINSIPPAKYDKNTGRYTVEIETGITSVDMKVIADYEYAGVDIYDPYTSSYTNNYELHQKQVQLSNLEPNQNYTLYFRIRSQDEMLSGVGDGKEYIVDLIRKSNNRKIDHVYAYPEDKTGKLFQSVVENITVNNPIIIKNITYGTSIVPIEIGADYSTARVGMTIDGVDTVSTNQTLKINIPFDSNDDDVDETTGERSRTFQVTVWSYEGDIAPAYYTLKIIRKMNNLKLKEITLDGRYAEQDRNDPHTFRIDVGADETLVNEIKATALNAGEYVEFENNGFALSSNSYLNYDVSTIPTSSSVTIDIKVGSPDLLSDGTTPDEIAITKLIITKLSPEELRSDLKLDMFVSDIKLVDSSYVKAAKQSEDKTLVNGKYVYTYNYISYINPTANMAYVKSQTKSASSKIEFFTDFGKPAIASGMLAVDTEASMSGIDDIILKARVTAGDGKTQDYTLMIQKASSELGIDKVYVDATGGLSTETQQTTRVTGKVTGYEAGVEPNTTAISYKVEMPMNTYIAQPFVFAIDPYAVIQFYEYRDGTYVLSNNKQIQGTNVNFAGATTDAASIEDRNLYKFRFKVTSRTNNASQEYVINLINSPEGTQLKNVNIGLRKEGYKDYPIDESEVILKNASITGLTTYLASVPQGRDTAVVKLISENKFAKIYVNGVHQNSAVNTYIDDVKLNGRVTQVPVTVESPSGATQNYTIYIVQYIYNFDLNTVVNDELTERIGDPVTNEDGVIISNYERPTKLPFYLNDADMQINMADPQGHKYYVQIDDGEKILVDDTTNEQTIKSTIKLKEVNSIVQLRVYDEDGFLITINNILIKRDMLDAALGAIRVNDNDAVKTTLDSGKIIYEAYSYSEAENPTAKVDIYAVDKNAAITLTGLTVSQTYTLGAGKGGQLTANVDLKVGDNYFSIELKKSDGSPSIYYTLRIKHIPVDVYLDDLYITKKDNSNKIPFYNSSFIKTVTTYSIKTENDLHEYDVYANAHETHQKLLDYAKTQGWNPNDYETRIKITDAGSEQIDDLSKYIKQYVNSMKTDGTTSEYFRIPIYLRVPHYTKTYYIEVHDPSDENRLADLQVIGYDLDPEFDKDNYKINKPTTDDEKKQGIYTVNVESEKTNADIYAKAYHNHDGAKTMVTILDSNKKPMSNAFVTITQNVNLEYGDNVFYVKVTSETSKELEYELHIYRKPIDASVKYILVNDMPAALQPDGTYVAYVESGTNPIVKAMASDSRATTTLKTNGAADVSAVGWVTLNVPTVSTATANVDINVSLTAGNDTISRDYVLKLISVTGDILSVYMDVDNGDFVTDTTRQYANPIAAVWNSENNRFEIGIPHNATYTPMMRVTTLAEGKTVKIGTLAEQNPDAGTTKQFTNKTYLMNNPQDITVTVKDVATDVTKTYIVHVTRMSGDADLIELEPESGVVMKPTFDKDVHNYEIDVDTAVTQVTFDKITASNNATIKLMTSTSNGSKPVINHTSGNSFVFDNLTVGNNILKIEVTSEDRITTKTYTVTINRKIPDTDATLDDIRVVIGGKYYSLVPMFDRDITDYYFIVEGENINDINIEATPSSAASDVAYKIDGGSTTKGTSVTIKDGLTEKSTTEVAFNVSASGVVMKEYKITLYKNINANINPKQNFLSSISLANHTLTMMNSSSDVDYNYYSNVTNTETEEAITVIPNTNVTGTDGNMTATLYDVANNTTETMLSGQPTPVKLDAGNNLFIVKVSDGNGNSRYYSITINRAIDKNTSALLSSLTASGQSMTPTFDKNVTSYKITVANDVDSIKINAKSENTMSAIWVRSEALDIDVDAVGTVNTDIKLVEGSNKIVITVTAPNNTAKAGNRTWNNTKKVYVINIYRGSENDNADLIDIKYTAGGILTPIFDSDETNYHLTYTYEHENVDLIPIARTPDAIKDITVTSSETSKVISSGDTFSLSPLAVGETVVTFIVRTVNGTEKTYTVSVYRNKFETPIPEITGLELKDQHFDDYAITPGFDKDEHSYYASVPSTFEKADIKVTAISNDPSDEDNLTIRVNGRVISSGTWNNIFEPIEYGDNIFTIELSNAQENKEYYTLVINRQQPDLDPKLIDLAVKQNFALSPAFDPDKTAYEINVDESTSYINLIPTANDAKITVNNIEVVSGMASENIELKKGKNQIKVVVTAIDNTKSPAELSITKRVYLVNVYRPDSDNDNALTELVLNKGTVVPAFTRDVKNYYVTVPYQVNKVTLETAALNPGSVIKVNGTEYTGAMDIDLTDGVYNSVAIKVYASADDSLPEVTYTLDIFRKNMAADIPDLSSLTVDGKDIIPDFSARELNYYTYVDASTTRVTINAKAASSSANVSGIGTFALNGNKTVRIITVRNGATMQKYSVTILRDTAINGISGTLNGDAITNSTLETITVPEGTTTIPLNITSADSDAIITVNGREIESGKDIDFTMSTQKERFDINVVSTISGINKSFVVYAESDADKPYEPFINHIMIDPTINQTGKDATFFTAFDEKVFVYSAVNDGATPYLFAKSDDPNVYIEVINETMRDYSLQEGIGSYLAQSIGESGQATFTFRATKFTESGYELINEYVVTVYNTDAPILTDLWTDNATMKTKFSPIVRNYDVEIGKDTEAFTVHTKNTYENAQVSMSIDGGAYVDGDVRTFDKLPLDTKNFTVTVKITVDEKDGIYVLNVTRLDKLIPEAFLENIELEDETVAGDGLYEMTPAFEEKDAEYSAKVNYTDNTITLTVTAKDPANDKLAVTTSDGKVTTVTSGTATEITLPSSFLDSEHSTETVTVTVENKDGKIGTYELKITRDDRANGDARLASLTTDKFDLSKVFNPEIFSYVVNISPYDEDITVTAEAKNPTDSIVFTHKGKNSAESIGSASEKFELDTGEAVDYVFVTVAETPYTYVIKIVRENTAYLSNIIVTDTVDGDGYEELNPKFDASVISYDVLVDPLATEIEFTIKTTEYNPILNMSIEGTQVASKSASELTHMFDLALNQKSFTIDFEIVSQVSSTVTNGGKYRVTVTRDTAETVPELQTYITGRVHSVAQGDDTAEIRMYDSSNNLVAVDAAGNTVYQVGLNGNFEISLPDADTYHIVISRTGYLDYEITNIVSTETFVKAKYDFGMIRITPGNVTDYDVSDGVIDYVDINLVNVFLYNIIMDDYTGQIIKDSITTTEDGTKDETKDTDKKDDSSDNPEPPDNGTPDNPSTPSTPDSGTPDNPSTPSTPDSGTPDNPETPSETPDTPSTPSDGTNSGDSKDDSTTTDTPNKGETGDNTSSDTETGDKSDNTETPSDGNTSSDNTSNGDTSSDSKSDNTTDSATSDSKSDSTADSATSDSKSDSTTDSVTSDSKSDSTTNSVTSDSKSDSKSDSAKSSESSYSVSTAVAGVSDYTEIQYGDGTNTAGAYYEANGKKIISWINFEGGRVERADCDFDGDGSITTKDLLYAGMYFGKKTPVLDNQGPDKVKIKAY